MRAKKETKLLFSRRPPAGAGRWIHHNTRILPLAALLMAIGGCALPADHISSDRSRAAFLPPRPASAEEIVLAGGLLPPEGRAEGAPLSLMDLLDLAARNHPDLGIARAQAEGVRGKLVQAGLYPNPTFTWDADDLGSKVHGAGTQGPIFSQTIVTAGKLERARAVVAQEVAAAEWLAVTRWFEVVTRVRLAYFEALTAQELVNVQEEVVALAQKSLDAAEALRKRGVGNLPDMLQARVEWRQRMVGLEMARQRLATAWKLLATASGLPALPASPLEGSLEALPPAYDWQATLERVLLSSSEMQMAQAQVLQVEQGLLKAQADAVPNVLLAVRPFYSFPDHDAQMKVELGMPVPIFNRNQGNLRTAQAEVARSHQEVRRVQLALTERLAAGHLRFQTALKQKEGLENAVADAKEALDLVRLAYERGDPKYDYATLLQAQRTEAQVRLSHLQALGELWRGASEIMGLIQVDPQR